MSSRGINPLITQNRLLSQARTRTRNGSASMAAAMAQSGSSNKNNALVDALKKRGGKDSLSEADQSQKNAYTVIEKTAGNIKKHAEKLLSWPEKSVDEMTDEEKAAYKKNVADEISSLVTDYNDMITGMENAGGKVNEVYLSQMRGYFKNAQKQLAELGITEDKKGKLVFDREKLESAEVSKIKETLGKKGTFIDDIGKRAENVLD